MEKTTKVVKKFVIGTRDNTSVWIEEFAFDVDISSSDMIKEVRKIVKNFNSGLRKGERSRKYIAKLN